MNEKALKWCDYHKSNNIYSFSLNPVRKTKIIYLYLFTNIQNGPF